MLGFISDTWGHLYGPLRLFQSYSVLIGLGLFLGFFITLFLLPKLYFLLPKDRGRSYAVAAEVAVGKPTSTGLIFISLFCILFFVLVHPSLTQVLIICLTWLTMLTGHLDDRAKVQWGEYLKGSLDLIISVATSITLFFLYFDGEPTYWLPFTNAVWTIHPVIFFTVSILLLWFSINSTNCTDGVDGLSGTLILIALFSLGLVFYFILGNIKTAKYLIVPYIGDGASWAVLIFLLAGCLMGYLWHNAYPSKALMGDAGSRALGFFVGVMVLISGNPFLLLMTSGVILINGGAGIFKIALYRVFHILTFKNIRLPLHDHMRKNLGWSPTQVFLRFIIIQIIITTILFGIIFKIR